MLHKLPSNRRLLRTLEGAFTMGIYMVYVALTKLTLCSLHRQRGAGLARLQGILSFDVVDVGFFSLADFWTR